MSKVFLVVFLIFGTVVGSGFASGKEIMVFFSRFGNLSYLFVLLAGVLFFALFYFFLVYGKKVASKIENSKILNLVILFISIVFCASMFAGMESLFSYLPKWANVVLFLIMIFACFIVTLRGMSGLERANAILMPIVSILFSVVLFFVLFEKSEYIFSINSFAGFLYCPLYVALNTSMSAIVISKAGESLTKKQAFYASLFSALLLFVFLFLGNTVLQRNPESFLSEMPFLYLASKNKFVFVLCYMVILVGCFTTLISLCSTIKSSLTKGVISEKFATFLSVFIPLCISMFGFSEIVSMLYPICSVLGVSVLLLFIFSFKQTDKIIHSKRKNTKYHRSGHD